MNRLVAMWGLAAPNPDILEVVVARATAPSFLGLPGEIRNQIYELVFTQDFHFRARSEPSLRSYLRSLVVINRRSNNLLSLLRVNRQIYAETRLLHFRFLTLVFDKIPFPSAPFRGPLTRDCNALLGCLQPWQIGEIQHLELAIAKDEITLLLPEELVFWALHNAYQRAVDRAFQVVWGMVEQAMIAWEQDINVIDLEDLGHWLAACFPSLTALRTLAFAGTIIRIDRERVDRILSIELGQTMM